MVIELDSEIYLSVYIKIVKYTVLLLVSCFSILYNDFVIQLIS